MRWPWKHQADSKRQDRAADARLRDAEALVAESRKSTAKLNREISKNGFTELFSQAMRRA